MIGMGLICPVWQFRDREQGKIAEFDLSVLAGDTRHPYRLQCEQFKLVGWLYDRLAETGRSVAAVRARGDRRDAGRRTG